MTDRICFLGTGLMGRPMAENLLRAGRSVTVWNRTPAKAEPLRHLGATIAGSPGAAAADAEVVIASLENGPVVDTVLRDSDLLERLAPQSLFIDMSSIPPQLARSHADHLRGRDVAYLDAPVSGGTKGAQAGTLAIMVGGSRRDYERARPILETMGHPNWVGEVGAGQLTKLVNQVIVAGMIGAVAEGILLSTAAGADPTLARTALEGGFADSTILRQHGVRMTSGDYVPGGANRTFLKDLDTALDEASRHGVRLPLLAGLRGLYEELVQNDPAAWDYDHSSLYLAIARRQPGAAHAENEDFHDD